MDSFDREILRIVQRDNRLSHAELGERVGLSASSVRRRLTALREAGVIQAEVAILDPDKDHITVVVLIAFHHETVEAYEAFKERMRAAPEVSQCYSVAGEVDFVLVVHAPDQGTYERWGERELMSDPAIRRYDSHIVWSRVKFSTAIDV